MEDKILTKYKILTEFLAEVMGEHCEVVLHDVEDFENSIVAIENNHISGRKIGDSLTDLALNVLKDEENLECDYLSNYNGKTHDGKELRSSTYFIRDEKEKVIAMLCINIDLSRYIEARDLLNTMIGKRNDIEENNTDKNFAENFTSSIEELIDSMIENSIGSKSIPPSRMTAEEKKEITKKLDKRGVFLLKNSVSKVAKKLQTSEATVYRYLNH
ncbi:YheO-like PAS domain [Halanaerobium saccharolyticum subsp. saccharolyticum DSM 6643]|uniref:YheO-like PAS domain n=1 Tax=Halanaerobium saccharolyticum subsp. saccharolyticum DSM 6643 TaxID=1293054 RepID=M5EFU8_9FIRM|nr:PAS domain-containing protein [Halanaerobium saccharolyticum]CCU80104.1 YheO-like PAS domain [Halanaerobium saccharolyticum subsp. saccharolyticum DSM 6643]